MQSDKKLAFKSIVSLKFESNSESEVFKKQQKQIHIFISTPHSNDA